MGKSSLVVLSSMLTVSLSLPNAAFAASDGGDVDALRGWVEPAEEPAEEEEAEAEADAEADAEPAEDSATSEEAKQLYKDGKTAFRLGKFEEAIGKFEQAYAISGAAALLLNIALANQRIGENRKDVQALRNSRTAYQNYLGEIRKNDLLDPSKVQLEEQKLDETIRALDARIGELEAETKASEEAENADGILVPDTAARRAALMKKSKLWLAGGGGGGAVLTAAGAALTVVFGLRGKSASDSMATEISAYNGNGCGTSAQTGTTCQETWDRIQSLKSDGDKANMLLYAVGLPVTVVGVAVLGAGVGMGLKFRKQAGAIGEEPASVSVLPSLGGLVLQGRF